MQRRTLLRLGALSSVSLAALGIGAGLSAISPALVEGRLSATSRDLMRVIACAVLDGVLPMGANRSPALEAHLDRVQATIRAFPPATQGELAQLLSILSTSLGCRALTGIAKPWGSGSIPELQSALQGMRVSRLSVRQQVYQALRDLTNGAYFADPSAWTLLTYPGPRDI